MASSMRLYKIMLLDDPRWAHKSKITPKVKVDFNRMHVSVQVFVHAHDPEPLHSLSFKLTLLPSFFGAYPSLFERNKYRGVLALGVHIVSVKRLF